MPCRLPQAIQRKSQIRNSDAENESSVSLRNSLMPGRVLIAEEQVECCQLFKMFLQRCGYEVTAVHDGMSCIEALQDGALPEVLILSWELPFGECEGVLGWLDAHGFDDMAIVVMTARMDADASQHEISLPQIAWLQRPFRLGELLEAVQSTERVPRDNCRLGVK
jgi:two-component system OmpR family response regulator